MESLRYQNVQYLVRHVPPTLAKLVINGCFLGPAGGVTWLHYARSEDNLRLVREFQEVENLIVVFAVDVAASTHVSNPAPSPPYHVLLVRQGGEDTIDYAEQIASGPNGGTISQQALQVPDSYLITDAYFQLRKLYLLLGDDGHN